MNPRSESEMYLQAAARERRRADSQRRRMEHLMPSKTHAREYTLGGRSIHAVTRDGCPQGYYFIARADCGTALFFKVPKEIICEDRYNGN